MTDIPTNPQSLVTAGAIVNASNPLPVTSVAAGTPGTDVTHNPVTWIVDGALVSTSNPLPLQLY